MLQGIAKGTVFQIIQIPYILTVQSKMLKID